MSKAIEQYNRMKEKYPDHVLFFRLGDFYEVFGQDARTAADVLGLTLTHRGETPNAGIPYHAIDGYLKKMIQVGYKVAVCERVEEPREVAAKLIRHVCSGKLIY